MGSVFNDTPEAEGGANVCGNLPQVSNSACLKMTENLNGFEQMILLASEIEQNRVDLILLVGWHTTPPANPILMFIGFLCLLNHAIPRPVFTPWLGLSISDYMTALQFGIIIRIMDPAL
ncbi:MAG: hypothetical protein GDA52_10010 [Rhodobacteraceae bacterium]|nr:hypothetical protein [Paracoccaceae bacterium]